MKFLLILFLLALASAAQPGEMPQQKINVIIEDNTPWWAYAGSAAAGVAALAGLVIRRKRSGKEK